MLAAILVGTNREVVSWVSNVCTELGDLCVYKSLTSYPQPYELAQLLDIFSPEVVLLDLESSHAASLNVIKQVRSGHPKTAVVGFAQHGPKTQFEEATRAGVTEIMISPFHGDELHKAVVRAIQTQTAGVADNIVAFMPAKGGSGATETALEIATLLARDWNQKLLLLETDLQSGYLAFHLNLEADPERSIVKALENSQTLNDTNWAGSIWKARGFDLAPMSTTKTMTEVTRWEYQRLLTFVRPRYQMVLVDLPELPTGATEALATEAKAIYIVTRHDQPSLFLARRRADELHSRGATDQRIKIVLNRCRDTGAGLAAAEKYLGRPVTVVLPHENPAAQAATSKRDGPPAPLVSERTQAFQAFARMLTGGPPPPRPTAPEPKKGLRQLLNRALQNS